ncbi:hypothetical protein TI39_contig309g00016 [Zymoseptoria brevis]|uniref:DUF6594 domain-containing protein n=1 Tax=Zymoseptoria brevis TaxID=1047168 RepID=A0A0F4GXD3_9PEZI|nr:hypothetical protein TI39_contig309g00016 [Zymoseptoria brevis]
MGTHLARLSTLSWAMNKRAGNQKRPVLNQEEALTWRRPQILQDTCRTVKEKKQFQCGFPGLVNIIAEDPDQDTFVFRKFKKLTAWSLVFMQNELTSLEVKLEELEMSMMLDSEAVPSRQTWARFEKRADMPGTVEWKMYHLNDQIREKLQNHHSALSSARSIADLKEPGERVIGVLRTAVEKMQVRDDIMGDYIPYDRKYERTRRRYDAFFGKFFGQQNLVALQQSADDDPITSLFRNPIPPEFSNSDGFTPDARIFEDKFATRLTGVVSVTLAVLIVVGSILTLDFVQSDGVKLGLLMMYIVIFVFGIFFTTGANRDSIFAATAAYSAVLIVFVSGGLKTRGA